MIHPADKLALTVTCSPRANAIATWAAQRGNAPYQIQTQFEREEIFRKSQEHRQMKRQILDECPRVKDWKESRQ